DRRQRGGGGAGGGVRARARAAGAAHLGAGSGVAPLSPRRVGDPRDGRGRDAGGEPQRGRGPAFRSARGGVDVNVTERTALLDGLVLHDELRATVDDRTLEILD